jgi:hypothetical protein
VKLGTSTTQTLEMLRDEAYGEHSLIWTVVFEWHSRFKASRVSVENDRLQGYQVSDRKCLKVQELVSEDRC